MPDTEDSRLGQLAIAEAYALYRMIGEREHRRAPRGKGAQRAFYLLWDRDQLAKSSNDGP